MSKEVYYNIYSFLQLPKSTKKQDLTNVIKLVVTKNEHAQDDTIAFDIENKEIISDPWMSSLGINSHGESGHIDGKRDVLNILESYNVPDWNG